MATLRYPDLNGVEEMAGHLVPGVEPRNGAGATFIDIEPNHATLHLSVTVDHASLTDDRVIFPGGSIPAELRPAADVQMWAATNAGGTFVAVQSGGRVQTGFGSDDLQDVNWIIGNVRWVRSTA